MNDLESRLSLINALLRATTALEQALSKGTYTDATAAQDAQYAKDGLVRQIKMEIGSQWHEVLA